METKIQKWGNSLAVRIPKAFVEEAQLRQGGRVDISVDEGRIVIDPRVKPEYTLGDLLNGVTERNLHGEVDTGAPVGREAW